MYNEQIYSFFYVIKLLYNEQFGFLPGGNTIKAVERVLEQVLENYETKALCAITLIDFSKAFDFISHDFLLKKMSNYGVRGKRLQLFSSYLYDKKTNGCCRAGSVKF